MVNLTSGQVEETDVTPHPYANQTWCFGFGELKWFTKDEFRSVQEEAIWTLINKKTGRGYGISVGEYS